MNKTKVLLISLGVIFLIGICLYTHDEIVYPKYAYVDQGVLESKIYIPEEDYIYTMSQLV